ncbi:MAG: hypothetical protein IJT76_08115 [Clostridia bacterium]|nr:hypothetical protein [Clostridia bacterium]
MNKQEILDRLRNFPYDPKDYWLITGSAMVFYGIKEQTGDIDLGCSAEMADRLEKADCPCAYTADGKRWFRYGDSIEIFEDWMTDFTQTAEGFRVVSLHGLLEMKQAMGREKDQKDIEAIREFLRQTSVCRACPGDPG